MIVGSNYRLSQLEHDFDIKVDDRSLERVKIYKYFGAELDEALAWHPHIDTITKEVSWGLGALKRARSLVPHETLIMTYKALVQPYLDYYVWGGIGKRQFERLQKLQNRAAQMVTYSDFNTRSLRLLDDLGWDTLEQRREKHLAVVLFKTINSLFPERLNNIFKNSSSVHSHNLTEVPLTTFLVLDH